MVRIRGVLSGVYAGVFFSVDRRLVWGERAHPPSAAKPEAVGGRARAGGPLGQGACGHRQAEGAVSGGAGLGGVGWAGWVGLGWTGGVVGGRDGSGGMGWDEVPGGVQWAQGWAEGGEQLVAQMGRRGGAGCREEAVASLLRCRQKMPQKSTPLRT